MQQCLIRVSNIRFPHCLSAIYKLYQLLTPPCVPFTLRPSTPLLSSLLLPASATTSTTPAISMLFASCRFALAGKLADDVASRALCDTLVAAIAANGGVVHPELDVAVTSHVILPQPTELTSVPNPESQNEAFTSGEPVSLTDEEVRARNSR